MKPRLTDVGTIVATRQLEGHENNNAQRVTVKIGSPFADSEDPTCWYCPYSIEWGNNRRVFYGAGVDSLQALRIAISMIETELATKFSHLSLTWMGSDDLGFSKEL